MALAFGSKKFSPLNFFQKTCLSISSDGFIELFGEFSELLLQVVHSLAVARALLLVGLVLLKTVGQVIFELNHGLDVELGHGNGVEASGGSGDGDSKFVEFYKCLLISIKHRRDCMCVRACVAIVFYQ